MWPKLRTDPRSFARLLRYSIPAGTDGKVVRAISSGKNFVAAPGIQLQTLAMLMCWRIACWPRSTCLVVSPTRDRTKSFFRLAHELMSKSPDEARGRILFAPSLATITCSASDIIGALHCDSGTLGRDLPTTDEPVTVIVPDFDRLPKPHMQYLKRWVSRPGTTVLVNSSSEK